MLGAGKALLAYSLKFSRLDIALPEGGFTLTLHGTQRNLPILLLLPVLVLQLLFY